MFQTTVVEKNQNVHIMFNNGFWKIVPFYEIMWKNTVEPGRSQMTVWCMRIACWMTKAADTHPEYVILIAFPYNSGYVNVSTSIAYLVCLYIQSFTKCHKLWRASVLVIVTSKEHC